MSESVQIDNSELGQSYEMTAEQWIDALASDREPERSQLDDPYAAETEAARAYAANGVAELERHANGLATRENIEHARDVEDARVIGQVAMLMRSYRDYELAV